MASSEPAPELKFAHNVIEHLGIKLYKNKSANVLAELLANSWDADSTKVDIKIHSEAGNNSDQYIYISDNGSGMSFNHIRDHYLHVGMPKRKKATDRSKKGRRPMGRKGLGKLAPFGISRTVDVASIDENLISWFTLDLDNILAVGSDGSYPPVFHVVNGNVYTPVTGGTNGVRPLIDEFRKDRFDSKESGTIIVMTTIPDGLVPNEIQAAADIGSRFTVVLARDDFSVSINEKEISEEDALPDFEFRIPAESGVTTEIVGGKSVSYWVGFVEKAEWSSDEAGVGVFAHGKIAQNRPFFFNKKGKEVFQRYLYGVVEADWIDEADEDLISTDRTSIDWNVDKLQPLHRWGQSKISVWINEYEKHRKGKQDAEVAIQAASLREAKKANTYSNAENDQIVKLVSNATREIGKTKSAAKVIPPFLVGPSRRIYAAVFSFMAGVMPPIPMLGGSLL